MFVTLCRVFRGPGMPSKEKEAFKSSKAVMRDHEGHNSLFIVPTKKENKSAFVEAFYCI